MSATNRGTVRAPHDAYFTPPYAVYRLLEAVTPPGDRWLSPCAGDGAILRAARDIRPDVRWIAVEQQARFGRRLRDSVLALASATVLCPQDFLAPDAPRPQVDAVLDNPPYSRALDFVMACLPLAPWVGFLLRLNWLASQERCAFLRRHPPDVYVLPDRPSFRGRGADATEYGWLVWQGMRPRRAGKIRVLAHTEAGERTRRRA